MKEVADDVGTIADLSASMTRKNAGMMTLLFAVFELNGEKIDPAELFVHNCCCIVL